MTDILVGPRTTTAPGRRPHSWRTRLARASMAVGAGLIAAPLVGVLTALPASAQAGDPTVTAVSPGSGPSSGGTQVTITGSNFEAGPTWGVDTACDSGHPSANGANGTCFIDTEAVGAGGTSSTLHYPQLTAANAGELYVGAAAVQETAQACGATPGAQCSSGGYTFNVTNNTNEFVSNPNVSGTAQPTDIQRPAGPAAAIGALFTSTTGPISAAGSPQDSPVYGAGGYSPSQFSVTTTTVGDLLVVSAHSKSPSDAVDSVSGGGVASWSRAVRLPVPSGDTTDNELWYGVVTNPGTRTVTFNWNSTPTAPGDYAEFVAQEFTAPSESTGVTSVDFGGTPASSFRVDSPTRITATVPAGSAGTVDVTVTNSNGTSATSPADRFTFTPGATLLNTLAVQGPGNSTYIYWQLTNAQWYGPYGVGARGSSFSAPSVAISPTTSLPTLAVEGPNNSTYVYWEAANAQWYGPLGVGGYGSSFSAPSIADSPTNGLPTVAVQGPNNSTYVYWEANNAQWYGPLGAGPYGSSFSAASIADSPTTGLPTVAVQGPNHATYVYWEANNAQWYGPLGVGPFGSSLSAPSIADSQVNGLPTVAVQGPNNSTYVFWEAANAQWYGPLGVGGYGSSFSAPSLSFIL